MSSKQIPCRNFNSPGGCKFGDKCFFLHQKSKPAAPQQHIARPPPINNVPKTVQPPAEPTNISKNSSHIHPQAFDSASLWGLESTDEGVYFYGAPGSVDWNPSSGLYASIAKLNISDEDASAPLVAVNEPAETIARPVCSFFLAGNCKFGARCKNLHINHETEETPAEPSESTSTMQMNSNPKECGICIEPSPTALYGLLSHCDCKFCLECIRGWRKEGLSIAKKADQVRLCPLCRTESYFVIPSSEFLTGDAKNILVETYKGSLSAKPCKYFTSGSECPFGTSCFYRHEEDGSKGINLRVFYKGEDEVVVNSKMKLGDFLRK